MDDESGKSTMKYINIYIMEEDKLTGAGRCRNSMTLSASQSLAGCK